MQAQVEGTVAQATLITGKRLLRVNHVTTQGRFTMNNSRPVLSLKALGAQSARQYEDEISRRFLFAPAGPFIPHHSPPSATVAIPA